MYGVCLCFREKVSAFHPPCSFALMLISSQNEMILDDTLFEISRRLNFIGRCEPF
jgi:hypothetical protein